MDKYSVDFSHLDNKINSPKVHKLADVQDRIEKVAFDVVRFKDSDDTPQLWRIEDSADGPVIVSMYDAAVDSKVASEGKVAEASDGSWKAIASSDDSVHVIYKGEAIKRIACKDAGISDAGLLCRWLPEKLASDKGFVKSLLSDIPKQSREDIYSKYPELRG